MAVDTQQIMEAAEKLGKMVSEHPAVAKYQAAQKVLSGRYTWFEADVLDPAGDGPMIPDHEPTAKERAKEAAATS